MIVCVTDGKGSEQSSGEEAVEWDPLEGSMGPGE